jgi:hypothetical protein
MITTAKIVKFDGNLLLVEPTDALDREIVKKHIGSVELRLNDGRLISNDQRRKIFAIIRDIAIWSGHEPEEIRALMTWDFICKAGGEWFSLSDVDMTTAKNFITWLIGFCFGWDIPTKDTLLHQTDDIGKYLYLCLEHRKCAICNAKADVHHVDRIGMGADRERVVHIGLKAIALCREHHDDAHIREKDLFAENYIYGIKLDEYLCKCLSLNTKNRRGCLS